MQTIDLTNVSPLKLLSHSSLETLHACPRKFEIYRMNYAPKEAATVDTCFGQVVGTGIQELLILQKERDKVESGSISDTNFELLSILTDLELAVWKMFLAWEVDIDEEKPKSKKSFATACLAVEKYQLQLLPLLANEWEIAYFEDKPAVELGFIIELPNGYYYRGYVDAVLAHKYEKRFRVLELKTTGLATVDVAHYKNSFQGVGYGVVLDKLAATLDYEADYYVDYLVYKTGSQEFLTMPFLKTAYQRAKWLAQLLLETKTIDMYLGEELFPSYGNNCFNFFRQCPYFGMCDKSNEQLVVKKPSKEWASPEAFLGIDVSKNNSLDVALAVGHNASQPKRSAEEFDFIISLEELVARQYEAQAAIANQQAERSSLQIEMDI